MSLLPEITPELIDDWFKVGKKPMAAVTAKVIPKSTTGGRMIDPKTLQPRVTVAERLPRYKQRADFHGGYDYASEYQQEEEERLRNRVANAALGQFSDTESLMSSHLETLDLDTLADSEVVPADLMPENATEVYKQYDFTPKFNDKLPISGFKQQIIETVETNQVTVIQGATGSGKTTQVSQYILDHYAQQGKYCNIIVTQPRRIAAISIARRVCQERGWQLGTVCGYQVGLDRVANEDTRILYCTTGILLNKLINEKNMHQFTHVILDEVHERDQDTDFSLLVVRKLLRTNSRHTRVILMSATFDSSMFAQYFALPVRDRLEPAPVVDVEGKPYQVREFYAEDLAALGEVPPLSESDPDISQEARHLTLRLIQEFDTLEEKDQGLSNTGFAPVRGTVLVFLPGLHEITDVEEALVRLCGKHQLKIIPLHSTITLEEQSQVFNMAEPGWRKIILSTNIAESSITVPDIKYVIDFCLTKNLICDFETNYTSLQVQWASKANCIQRKGRSGRVSKGRVYRLITRHFYENCIPDYGIPEMQRCPLDKLILQVKVLDLGEPKAILALALAPPNLADIERNILLLKEVGGLTTSNTSYRNRHDGELTFVGRVLAALPVDSKIGKLLVLGHVFGLLEECLIIGAALSLKSFFAQPFKQRLEAYRGKLHWADGSLSDCVAILNAYQTWERMRDRGEFRRTGGGGEGGWCKQRYLQIRRLKEVTELIKDLEKRLVKFNILKPKHRPNLRNQMTDDQKKLLLKVVICGAFYPNYFVRGEIDEMESLKLLSGKNPLNTVMVKGVPANQGTLYKQPIEDLFRRCDANPKAFCEETRAYIEFPWRSSTKSKVHPGVYMALKMVQLRMPLAIDLYTQDEARAMLQRLQEAQDRVTSPNQLRTNRVTATGEVLEEPGTRRMGRVIPPPDPSKEVLRLCVTEVVECGHFWAQFFEEENQRQLDWVQSMLNRDGGRTLVPIQSRVLVGMFCVAPFMDDKLHYYRARVQAVENKYDDQLRAHRETVEVFFVDYGNTSVMLKEDLRELPDEVLEVPFQALECQLIRIRPSPVRCADGIWTKEATEAFKEMTLNHYQLSAIPYSVVHGVLRVDLVLIAPNYDQVFLNQQLVEMGFAYMAEESAVSKQSNEQRLAAKAQEAAQGAAGRTEQRSDWLHVSLPSQTNFGTNIRKGARANLTGPVSPYEMNFYNITNVGRMRSAKITPESVNSVAIDDAPHEPHQRLMVAGFVGLNPNGSSVIARDTTIMPLIPGLGAIITLLFTPVAEFRVNEQKTRYIGAICGLGTESDTGDPVLPDHDIELQFDVKFTLEDIFKINGVRLAINFAIGNQDTVASWGPDAVLKIQNTARQKILSLIQTKRESCEVENPRCMYQWNQLDPDEILTHNVPLEKTPTLLNLHTGVALQDEEGDESSRTEDRREAEKNRIRRHVASLRDIVRQKMKRTPTLCELCNITCPTPQLLALHLETQRHKTLEERLQT